MGTCSEARRLKERFHKYRMSLKKKADLAKEHQAEIQMVLFRKGVLYDIPGDRREVSSRQKDAPRGQNYETDSADEFRSRGRRYQVAPNTFH